MKKISVRYICLYGIITLFSEMFHSCTESQPEIAEREESKLEILFQTSFLQEDSGNCLLTKLYVFGKDNTGSYRLTDSLSQIVSGSTRLKMNLADLNKYDYRFLFVATPELKPEIQAETIDHSPFTFGTEWEKAVIEMVADSMSVNNYYGITDLSGYEILQSKTIEGKLTRLVGQMVFCFYKVGLGGIKDPVAVNDPKIASVFDRISSIEITYEDVARQVTFDATNHPVAVPGSKHVLNHTIRFSQSEKEQKVILPQPENSVEVADSIPGGGILKGTCLLPSKQRVRVSMIFHYYDTTPICQEPIHIHAAACYTPMTLLLCLPKVTESQGLDILPDHFTINNAAFSCNRVIDVRHTSGIDVNTTWN
ncbi:DUF5031 domain-containing protein [Bacteroides thetaiotaomicron]|nr:DUF5031 domain-containing protein [Bacteroides thetaiotaomicron]MCA6030954.1 DUF5031 domain-containing protein [Bacteroides thetaiotaomicron]MCS2713061.1 DUF5031 domain-containing protein [Bacteroides thetaiotaomicron]MCS2873237.1 DUF5031 domain-containing protein [Bacteroides thetaiotaomicron]